MMALEYLVARKWIEEKEYKKVKRSSNPRSATIAKAINTVSEEKQEKIENSLDAFKKAVIKLNEECK
jgi:predicted transcriptional regulator